MKVLSCNYGYFKILHFVLVHEKRHGYYHIYVVDSIKLYIIPLAQTWTLIQQLSKMH